MTKKLTPEQRAEILARAIRKEPFADIAKATGIPHAEVSRLCAAALWRGEIEATPD